MTLNDAHQVRTPLTARLQCGRAAIVALAHFRRGG